LAKGEFSGHWELFEPLEHLLRRSLEAIPTTDRGRHAFDMLLLPLPEEQGIRIGWEDWPELADVFDEPEVSFGRGGLEWDQRIAELLAAVGKGGSYDRERSVQRLAILHRRGLLTPDEQTRFAAALWRWRAGRDNGFP